MARYSDHSHFCDLPDSLISSILSLISSTRTRNSISLVCLKWRSLERSTRTTLALRGNIQDLFLIPTCFHAVVNLDLSLLSPYGHPILDKNYHSPNPNLLAQFLARAFPSVVSLTLYARTPTALQLLAPRWPNIREVKLVRWHQRPSAPLGSDFLPLLEHCKSLSSVDLSQFYFWTEDLPLALRVFPSTSASISRLNILSHTITGGFNSQELIAIASACPHLRELMASCIFDHRLENFVGDETLLAIASNCPLLIHLHLADISSSSNPRPNPNQHEYNLEDSKIKHNTLVALFERLPLLEELGLEFHHNMREAWIALQMLNARCPRLRSLTLGRFNGIFRSIEGVNTPLCKGLESLSIKNSVNLKDSCLVSISHGCPKLATFEVVGCERITENGVREMGIALRGTLTNVIISACKNLNALCSIRALEPVHDRIKNLHIDCVWQGAENSRKQERKNSISNKIWCQLQRLSLWIAVGDDLTLLHTLGLSNCPVLEEVRIQVEGDTRVEPRPKFREFGLGSLACYPRISRLKLDCSGAIGFSLTAPPRKMDLSQWERFFLSGIKNLNNLCELDYWPPQDRDFNRRSLSLPAVGLIGECELLRKVLVHGNCNEHLVGFLLRVPNLRDVQLRDDYYPAPENDASSGMRGESCRRFEVALNRRPIPN